MAQFRRAVWTLVRQHEDRVRKILADDTTFADNRLRGLYCLVVGGWHRRRAGAPTDALRPANGADRSVGALPVGRRSWLPVDVGWRIHSSRSGTGTRVGGASSATLQTWEYLHAVSAIAGGDDISNPSYRYDDDGNMDGRAGTDVV
jgi:hypothetical protein